MATKKKNTASALVPRHNFVDASTILSQHADKIDRLGLQSGKVEFNVKTGMVKVSGTNRNGETVRQHLLQSPGLQMGSMSVAQPMRSEASKIKQRRKSVAALDQEGYVQVDIAEILGVSQPTICADLRAIRRRRD